MHIKTEIIPVKQKFIGKADELDYAAICVFAATGFFLDQDTYYKKLKVLKPATAYELDDKGEDIISESSYFKWHYSPRERSLEAVVQEFSDLFESIIKEQISNKEVILPISGGLDSRTQAVALSRLGVKVNAYGYSFKNGHNETRYGKRIAELCDFPFTSYTVTNGYLWEVIEDLAKITKCYSEFTHPRQMAFINHYRDKGEVFSLGHWGDVLFDNAAAFCLILE